MTCNSKASNFRLKCTSTPSIYFKVTTAPFNRYIEHCHNVVRLTCPHCSLCRPYLSNATPQPGLLRDITQCPQGPYHMAQPFDVKFLRDPRRTIINAQKKAPSKMLEAPASNQSSELRLVTLSLEWTSHGGTLLFTYPENPLCTHEPALHPHFLRHMSQPGHTPQDAPQLTGLEDIQAGDTTAIQAQSTSVLYGVTIYGRTTTQ
jgi:hypothetical protein